MARETEPFTLFLSFYSRKHPKRAGAASRSQTVSGPAERTERWLADLRVKVLPTWSGTDGLKQDWATQIPAASARAC